MRKAFWRATRRFFKESYTYRASALAFTTLFGLVPFLSVLMFISSKLSFFNHFIQLIENYLFENLLPSSIGNIQAYLSQFVDKTRSMPTLGVIFFATTALLLIVTVSRTFNTIWGPNHQGFQFKKWLSYWLILILSPLALALTIFLSLYLFSVSIFTPEALNKLPLLRSVFACLPLAINTLIFSLIYIVTPNRKVQWKNGVLSGLTAALMIEVTKKGFSYYILHFPTYELIYGILATLPIFLIWLYLIWSILLFGALFNHELHH